MDIVYLIFLTLALVIVSIILTFKSNSLKGVLASFILLVIAGVIVTTT